MATYGLQITPIGGPPINIDTWANFIPVGSAGISRYVVVQPGVVDASVRCNYDPAVKAGVPIHLWSYRFIESNAAQFSGVTSPIRLNSYSANNNLGHTANYTFRTGRVLSASTESVITQAWADYSGQTPSSDYGLWTSNLGLASILEQDAPPQVLYAKYEYDIPAGTSVYNLSIPELNQNFFAGDFDQTVYVGTRNNEAGVANEVKLINHQVPSQGLTVQCRFFNPALAPGPLIVGRVTQSAPVDTKLYVIVAGKRDPSITTDYGINVYNPNGQITLDTAQPPVLARGIIRHNAFSANTGFNIFPATTLPVNLQGRSLMKPIMSDKDGAIWRYEDNAPGGFKDAQTTVRFSHYFYGTQLRTMAHWSGILQGRFLPTGYNNFYAGTNIINSYSPAFEGTANPYALVDAADFFFSAARDAT